MKQIIPLFLGGLILIWAGCASSTPPYQQANGPYVKPGLIMVPADQAHLYGIGGKQDGQADTPPPANLSAVDSRGVVQDTPPTAIQFNRYTDPANKNMMHEGHIVYRKDPASWRLRAAPPQQVLVGPQISDSRGEMQPIASQELESYLREQRVALVQNQQLMAGVGKMITQIADQQKDLAGEVLKLKEEQQALESSTKKDATESTQTAKVNSPADQKAELPAKK